MLHWEIAGGHGGNNTDGSILRRLNGGEERGGKVAVASKEHESLTDLAEQTWQSLLERIAAYDQPEQPYLSHPHPGQEPRFADYARLARVPEWNTGRAEPDA